MSTHAEASLEKLARLLNQVAGTDPSTVLLSSRLKEDLDLESLEMMELLFKAEDEFGLKIEIPIESLADIKTVEDLLDSLLAKQ
jgi:acyl carrier protein